MNTEFCHTRQYFVFITMGRAAANLRFYVGSVRYSEDIDFDVMAKGMLANKVDRLLPSPLVTAPLKAKGNPDQVELDSERGAWDAMLDAVVAQLELLQ